MTAADWALWAGVAAALVVGAGGWIAAGIANGRAKRANALAAASNDIAASAVAKADKANKISAAANKLSGEANDLVRKSISQQHDDWFVEWKASWDRENACIALLQVGKDPAKSVSVLITGKDVRRAYDHKGDVKPLDQLLIPVDGIAERRAEHEGEPDQYSSVIVLRLPFSAQLRVRVQWKSAEGVPGTQVLTVKAD